MMKASAFCVAVVAAVLVGTSGQAASSDGFTPKGAQVGRTGFATIETVPVTPGRKPERDDRPKSEAGFYALEYGLSQSEALKRIDEQQKIMPEFERLLATLRARENGNFTSSRMIHQPDWGYEFYFKRDAAASLAKYTRNPRFKPATARYSLAELEAIAKPWTDRFTGPRLTSGWGMDDTRGSIEIMMNVTADEYDAIAAAEGWGPVPQPIQLQFAKALPTPSVDERVRGLARVFAQNDRNTGIQLLAAGGGRIVMRDGCLYVKTAGGQPDRLAYFHRETGLGLDQQGYLALIDRATGQSKGRIGEMFTWGGPNAVAETYPLVKELRTQCGNAPLLNVGNPESSNMFRTRLAR